jgi:hypothetical protein
MNRKSCLDASTTSETTAAASTTVESRASTVLKFVFLAIPSLGAHGRLLVGGRNNLGGESQISSEVFNTLIRQVAVVVLPGKGNSDKSPGTKRLHQIEDFQVGRSLNLGMSGGLGVLLDDTDALLEQIRKDCDAVFFGNKHDESLVDIGQSVLVGMLVVFFPKHENRWEKCDGQK